MLTPREAFVEQHSLLVFILFHVNKYIFSLSLKLSKYFWKALCFAEKNKSKFPVTHFRL